MGQYCHADKPHAEGLALGLNLPRREKAAIRFQNEEPCRVHCVAKGAVPNRLFVNRRDFLAASALVSVAAPGLLARASPTGLSCGKWRATLPPSHTKRRRHLRRDDPFGPDRACHDDLPILRRRRSPAGT